MNKRNESLADVLSGGNRGFNATELEGFVIPTKPVAPKPSITLDSFDRFYIGAEARRLMELRSSDSLSFAYNADKKTLAVIDIRTVPSYDMRYTNKVDSRFYIKAKNFVRYFGLKQKDAAPRYFDYVGEASTIRGVYLFRLRE